jgi:hypothetical protein
MSNFHQTDYFYVNSTYKILSKQKGKLTYYAIKLQNMLYVRLF